MARRIQPLPGKPYVEIMRELREQERKPIKSWMSWLFSTSTC